MCQSVASTGYHNCLGRYVDAYGATWRLRNRVAIKRAVRIIAGLLVDSAWPHERTAARATMSALRLKARG
jgi:hypothetical protein